MARKRSMMHKLIEHASLAEDVELDLLIQALQAVKALRGTKVAEPRKVKPRKSRSDAGKSRTRTATSTPPASSAAEASSSEN